MNFTFPFFEHLRKTKLWHNRFYSILTPWCLSVCGCILHISLFFSIVSIFSSEWDGIFYFLYFISSLRGFLVVCVSSIQNQEWFVWIFFYLFSFLSSIDFLFYLFRIYFCWKKKSIYILFIVVQKWNTKKKQINYDNLLCNGHQPILLPNILFV